MTVLLWLALLIASRGATDCHRSLHVHLWVDSVQCCWFHSCSAGVVHQWASLDVSTDSPSASRNRYR